MHKLLFGSALCGLLLTSFAEDIDCDSKDAVVEQVYYKCNPESSSNSSDCQVVAKCHKRNASDDIHKYDGQHLTRKQVNDFLIDIKSQVNTESGLLKFVAQNGVFRNKPYYGTLNCSDKVSHKIKRMPLTSKFVENNYNTIFSPAIKNIIKLQRESDIFSNDEGLMFGDGAIWFNINDKNKIVIKAINTNVECPAMVKK